MTDEEYRDALKQSARNLVRESRKGRLQPTRFRDREIAEVLEVLDRNASVLLTGEPGVGKTSVIRGLAAAMADRGRGRLWSISTAEILAGTRYIGEWQTKLDSVTRAAAKKHGALYVTDLWNLATAGKTVQDPSSFLDAVRPRLEQGKLRLVGEVTPEVLRAMQRIPGFVELFVRVRILPLADEHVAQIIAENAEQLGLELDQATARAAISVTSRFRPEQSQPGPTLELLSRVQDYLRQKEGIEEIEPLTGAFVEKVFSIYSGLPRFVVSASESKPTAEIRRWFEARIIGQRRAIEAIVEMIAVFKAGLHDPRRPLGSFLFIGPTGVGKTEIAKALASFLFGSERRMLRFDMSEFKDYHSFELLVGDPDRPGQPARLIDPVRSQPFQLVLFDELEKAHGNVWDLFLQLLDEGTVTPPSGGSVDFRNTIVIATSNVGAEQMSAGVGFGEDSPEAHEAAARKELGRFFRPELLNRFQYVVVFHSLDSGQVRTIAEIELRRMLERQGISDRQLLVDVSDEALDFVVAHGFDPKWGARGLKREIQRRLILPLAITLTEKAVSPGSLIHLGVDQEAGRILVKVVAAAEAEGEHEAAKVTLATRRGRTELDRDQLAQRATELEATVEEIATDLEESALEDRRVELDLLRSSPEFWRSHRTSEVLLELDRVTTWLERLSRLRSRVAEVSAGITAAPTRNRLTIEANRLIGAEERARAARRELIGMGHSGYQDALIELRTVTGGGREGRDFLWDLYRRWNQSRGGSEVILFEPMDDHEPILALLRGPWASGYLKGETGLHRFRRERKRSAVRVRVVGWNEQECELKPVDQRALKSKGQLGGRIRSRVAFEGGLTLQNSRPLAENREFAGELGNSWRMLSSTTVEVVRRVDFRPFRVRDFLLGLTTENSEVLKPARFHQLLGERCDAEPSGSTASRA